MKATSKTPLISCRKCSGTGKIELSDKLSAVFFIVKNHKNITAPEIHDALKSSVNGLGVTAINQRLSDLMQLNLVSRTRIGTAWKYSVRVLVCVFALSFYGCSYHSDPNYDFYQHPERYDYMIHTNLNEGLHPK